MNVGSSRSEKLRRISAYTLGKFIETIRKDVMILILHDRLYKRNKKTYQVLKHHTNGIRDKFAHQIVSRNVTKLIIKKKKCQRKHYKQTIGLLKMSNIILIAMELKMYIL